MSVNEISLQTSGLLVEPLMPSKENAISASLQGHHSYAIWAYKLLLSQNSALLQELLTHPSPAVQLDILRACGQTPRVAEIYRPCPLLGATGEKLDAKTSKIILSILGAHWDAWGRSAQQPPRSNVFTASAGFLEKNAQRFKVAIVFSKHINCNPQFIESDYFLHLKNSAPAAGLKTVSYDSGEIQYECADLPDKPPLTRPYSDALADFSKFLDREKPDFVITDGNYIPRGSSIDADFWNEQKQKLGFKLGIIIPDCYDSGSGSAPPSRYALPWRSCADLLMTFHGTSIQLIGFDQWSMFPIFPIHEQFFEPACEKDYGISCVGSNTRNRMDWMAPVLASNVPVSFYLHDRLKKNAPSSDEYFDILKRSRLVFNNGYISELLNITTGRFFEGVISRALVLQERGSPIDEFFVPFIHYVPVTCVDQVISYAQFFLENEEWRSRITDAARSYWDEHYSSKMNWSHICWKLFGQK